MVHIDTIHCGLYGCNCYHLWREGTQSALLIDTGDGLEAILDALKERGTRPEAILLTHGHFDHILAAAPLAERYGCPVYIHAQDAPMLQDPRLACYREAFSRLPFVPLVPEHPFTGDSLSLPGFTFRVYHTPGHTPGSVCYRIEGEDILFTGDTLFAQGYGRTDLPGGNTPQLIGSLRRLLAMDPDIRILPGHGEGSSIGEAARYLC